MAKVNLLGPLRGNENKDTRKRKEMHENRIGLLWLARRWPKAFPDNTNLIHPLAIGIREKLIDAVSSEPDTASSRPDIEILLRALQVWTRSAPYIHAAAHGKPRVDLDGNVVEELDPKHQQFAKDLIDRRKRKPAKTTQATPLPVRPPKVHERPVLSLRRAQA